MAFLNNQKTKTKFFMIKLSKQIAFDEQNQMESINIVASLGREIFISWKNECFWKKKWKYKCAKPFVKFQIFTRLKFKSHTQHTSASNLFFFRKRHSFHNKTKTFDFKINASTNDFVYTWNVQNLLVLCL